MAEDSDMRRAIEGTMAGNEGDRRRLFAQLYDELREVAARHLRAERGSHTLQPTALVHEVWLKLSDQQAVPAGGREHFLSVASAAMRRILIDHFRRKNRSKRGGGQERVTLQGVADGGADVAGVDVIGLDAALRDLAAISPRQAQVVELRFFGGLEMADIAAVLDISDSTVTREWRVARAWLGTRIDGQE